MITRQCNKLLVGDVLLSSIGCKHQQHHLQEVLLMHKLFLEQACELHALVK